MRWEALFADLEAQMVAPADEDVAELVRAEVARTPLADRLRAHVGAPLVLRLRDARRVRGVVVEAAPQWLLLAEGEGLGDPLAGGARVLVPLGAVDAVSGLSRAVAPPPGVVEARLGLGRALRGLARERAAVGVALLGGDVTGTVDRVGADHLDLAVHPVGEARRPGDVTDVLALPFRAVLAVRSLAAPAPGGAGARGGW